MSKVPGYIITAIMFGVIGSAIFGWDGFVWGCVIGWAVAHLYFAVGESDAF